MTRTKRSYNKNRELGFYHPFHAICCGNCKRCKEIKDKRKAKKEKRKRNKNVKTFIHIKPIKMPQCSFCENEAIKRDDGYFLCSKCLAEERKFLSMNSEEQEKVLKLHVDLLDNYDELIDLEKKRIGVN